MMLVAELKRVERQMMRYLFPSWPGLAVRRTASLPLAYVPAIHAFIAATPPRRGCPAQGRA